MTMDRVLTEEEPFRDLLVVQSLRDQAQDFDLPRGGNPSCKRSFVLFRSARGISGRRGRRCTSKFGDQRPGPLLLTFRAEPFEHLEGGR